jgi:hypothetical protein
MARRPADPIAGQPLTLAQQEFQLELLRLRAREEAANPPAVKPPYYRKTVLASSQLPPAVPLPKCHRDWRGLVQPRQFPDSAAASTADAYRAATSTNSVSFGGSVLATSGREPMPAQPANATEYYTQASALDDFMVASGRFSAAESVRHKLHIRHVMKLWATAPEGTWPQLYCS